MTALPVLALGLYVFKSNSKELTNRVFALFCCLWTVYILALNLVSLSTDLDTAILWNRISVYSLIVFLGGLIHFVLVFPHRSGLLKHRWLIPSLYLGVVGGIAAVINDEALMIRTPTYSVRVDAFSPEFRPVLYFLYATAFMVAVVTLVLRYSFTDFDITRKRLLFVTFAVATYALYENIGDLHTNADPAFLSSFQGPDVTFWRLTLAMDALLFLSFFVLLALNAVRTRVTDRRKEALILGLSGFAALVTGFFDPIVRGVWTLWPGVLWLWRIAAVTLMFYAILRYQLFDLNVRMRAGVRYGTMTTVFAAIFFTVQELVKDLGGSALGYFAGVLAAAALVFLFEPVQRWIEKFSHRVVPAESTDTYEKFRSMEIYKAALEGALADKTINPDESISLKNLRAKLGISDADHHLLERDIKNALEKLTA